MAESIKTYIHHHPVAVLGTVSANDVPHGAAVYVAAESDERVYIVTKEDTQKYKNLQHSSLVSLTIVDPTENSTLQANGQARVVFDEDEIGKALEHFAHIYARGVDWLPPIAKISAGNYVVVRITLQNARLAHFHNAHAGDPHIFSK